MADDASNALHRRCFKEFMARWEIAKIDLLSGNLSPVDKQNLRDIVTLQPLAVPTAALVLGQLALRQANFGLFSRVTLCGVCVYAGAALFALENSRRLFDRVPDHAIVRSGCYALDAYTPCVLDPECVHQLNKDTVQYLYATCAKHGMVGHDAAAQEQVQAEDDQQPPGDFDQPPVANDAFYSPDDEKRK